GSALAWLGLRLRSAGAETRLSMTERDLAVARAELARQQEVVAKLREQAAGLESTLQHERQAAAEKLELIDRASTELREAFQALASDALRSNNQSFLQLAKASLEKFQSEAKGDLESRQKAVENLVVPIKESLNKVDSQIQQMEKERSQAYGTLTEQVQSLIGTQKALQAETGNLVKALRTPSVRGRWGEIQLKRVVEIAGMQSYCDFDEQVTVTTVAGRDFLQRGFGAGSGADRAGREPARDCCFAHYADCVAEGGRLRVEPGKAGAQCAADQRARERVARPAAQHVSAHGQPAPGAGS